MKPAHALLVGLLVACKQVDAPKDDTDDTDLPVDTDTDETVVVETDTDTDDTTPTGPGFETGWDSSWMGIDTDPPVDMDSDGFAEPGDCNDNDASIYPGAPEVCDGIDQDCDNNPDPIAATFYPVGGAPEDLTATLLGASGAPAAYTLDRSGNLLFCVGTWNLNLTITASDVYVATIGDAVLSPLVGTAGDAPTVRISGSNVRLANLALTRSDGTIVEVDPGVTDVTLASVLMQDGDGGADGPGGLLVGDGSTVTVTDGRIQRSFGELGGAALVRSGAVVTFDGTLLQSNSALSGGAIAVEEGGSVMLTDARIVDNIGTASGGGVHAASGAQVTVDGCTFDANTSTIGAAAFATGEDTLLTFSGAPTTIGRSSGGAIAVEEGAGAVLTGTLFSFNTSGTVGAAVKLAGDGEVTMTDVSLTDNTSGDSGAVHVSGGTLTLTRPTFERTSATSGSAVHVTDGAVTITDGAMIDGDTRERGGAVLVSGGTLDMSGTTLLRNDANTGGALFVEGGEAMLTNCDLGASVDDNTPDDAAVQTGLSYSWDGVTTVVCTMASCL